MILFLLDCKYTLQCPMSIFPFIPVPCRFSNTLTNQTIEKHRKSKLSHTKEIEDDDRSKKSIGAPRDYKYVCLL